MKMEAGVTPASKAGGIDEGFESGAGLPRRLQGVVELVHVEVETAFQSQYRAAVYVQGDQRPLDGRQLRQPPAVLPSAASGSGRRHGALRQLPSGAVRAHRLPHRAASAGLPRADRPRRPIQPNLGGGLLGVNGGD